MDTDFKALGIYMKIGTSSQEPSAAADRIKTLKHSGMYLKQKEYFLSLVVSDLLENIGVLRKAVF